MAPSMAAILACRVDGPFRMRSEGFILSYVA